jgi:uncharacterized membrane protein YeaQ/YmgE (transglycosylase-associated protein family)
MSILGWVLLGLIAGMIARAILPGNAPGGLVLTMLVGIGGALIGGFLGRELTGANPIHHFFNLSTWVAAVIGAVIVLAVFGALTGNRRRLPI